MTAVNRGPHTKYAKGPLFLGTGDHDLVWKVCIVQLPRYHPYENFL
jgi:hypothetical protein